MKQVKNKMTGDIGELDFDSKEGVFIVVRYDLLTKVTSKSYYKNLKDLDEEWEDYEESKEYYFIRDDGSGVGYSPIGNSTVAKRRGEIGNYFGTEEEAEKAVRKLEAWKRLKDKGLKIHLQKQFRGNGIGYSRTIYTDFTKDSQEIVKDLDLLFGGEE